MTQLHVTWHKRSSKAVSGSRKRIFEMSGATSKGDDVESTVLCAIGVVSKLLVDLTKGIAAMEFAPAVETTALADLAKEIDEMRRKMAARDEEMAARDEEMAARDKEIKEMKMKMAASDEEMASRDKEIKEMKMKMAARDEEMAARDEEMAARDEEMAARDEEIKEMKKRLDAALSAKTGRKVPLTDDVDEQRHGKVLIRLLCV